MQINPIADRSGAVISGIDLSKPLAAESVSALRSALDEYAFLVFHQQRLATQEHIDFGQQFGPVHGGLSVAYQTPSGNPLGVADVSNTNSDGEVVGRSSFKIINQFANRLWHKDAGGGPVSYSILHALEVTDEGGETEIADLRAAYDELPSRLKSAASERRVVHDPLRSRTFLGMEVTPEQSATLPKHSLPLVQEHAGRKHLFIGAHASHIEDLSIAEGRVLLIDLLEHATKSQFVYTHKWTKGDVLMWDNRTTAHRGLYYDLALPRRLRRVTIAATIT